MHFTSLRLQAVRVSGQAVRRPSSSHRIFRGWASACPQAPSALWTCQFHWCPPGPAPAQAGGQATCKHLIASMKKSKAVDISQEHMPTQPFQHSAWRGKVHDSRTCACTPIHSSLAMTPDCFKYLQALGGRHDQVPVQLEGVWPISVHGLPLQILWQIDDHDGIKWAFLQNHNAVDHASQEKFCALRSCK